VDRVTIFAEITRSVFPAVTVYDVAGAIDVVPLVVLKESNVSVAVAETSDAMNDTSVRAASENGA